jgi:hypothetical protein
VSIATVLENIHRKSHHQCVPSQELERSPTADETGLLIVTQTRLVLVEPTNVTPAEAITLRLANRAVSRRLLDFTGMERLTSGALLERFLRTELHLWRVAKIVTAVASSLSLVQPIAQS